MANSEGLKQTLDVFAASAKLGQHELDAFFVDGAQRGIGHAQAHPAVLAFDPEPATLQVGHEMPAGAVVGMGNVVPHHRRLTGDCTDSSHGFGSAWDVAKAV